MIRKIKLSEISVNTGQVPGLPSNPRFIKDGKFEKLQNSLREDPEMLQWRPLVVFPYLSQLILIGGNMRYRVLAEDGIIQEVDCMILPADTTVEKLKKYLIVDNVSYGEWDHDLLANEWDFEELLKYGMDLPWIDPEQTVETEEEKQETEYSKSIKAPTYEAKNEKPAIKDLFNADKVSELIREIHSAQIPEAEKDFLIAAAARHRVFHYQKIADYYAHSSPLVQDLMEKSALVIIDFSKAIERGFIELTKNIQAQYLSDDDGQEDEDD